MHEPKKFGVDGEVLAEKYLCNNGYEILERNWRCGHKEIDIICRNSNTLIIVEVKSRSTKVEMPSDLLPTRKMENLVEAADSYLEQNGLNCDIRFDLIIVSADFSIEHIKDIYSV